MVRDSRKPEANFVKIKVDNMHEEYFRLKQLTLFDSDTKLHCYFMGSLMTVVREFRTIKNCEFFSTGPTILNPSLVLNNQLACNEPLTQKMRDFLAKNQTLFNHSQLDALNKVCDMKQKDILLIQGPVSYTFRLNTFSFSLVLVRHTRSTGS